MPLPSPRPTLVAARPILRQGHPDPTPATLSAALPEDVPGLLRRASALYRETAADVQCGTRDAHAGKVWLRLARILETAATMAEGALD